MYVVLKMVRSTQVKKPKGESMRRNAMKFMSAALLCALAMPAAAMADEAALQLKVDELTKKVDKLQDKSLSKWLTIGGDYRFRLDSLRGEVPAHSSAVGTLFNMIMGPNGFTANPAQGGVAGTTIIGDPNGAVSPNGTQFIMQGKSGALFTPTQFNTIINTYMPQAMFNFLTVGGNNSQFAQAIGNVMGAAQGNINTALTNTAFTTQQAGILNTLTAKGVFNSVFTMLGNGNLQTGQQNFQAQIGQLATQLGITPAQAGQLANQVLLQSFLGAPSPFLSQVPAFKPKNDTLYTNRLGIDLHAKATKDVTVNVRLVAYKTFGSSDDSAVTNGGSTPYFADRVGVFDGTLGHIPSSSLLDVDRAYATWANIADLPVWISVGRRPATNGAPSNLRLNNERPGNGGTPALLVDYAFDGMTIGWAPDVPGLPGAYAKICYGRAFESGYDKSKGNNPTGSTVTDTDMVGVAVIPIDTDPLRIWLQWNRGMNIFDFPVMNNTAFGNTGTNVDLGSIDWWGGGMMSTIKNVGPGNLNFFADGALSIAHPNNNVSNNAGFQGLMTGQFFNQDFNPTDKTGWGAYVGARYDFTPSKTKLGFEYNHGSKYWQPFVPAADDIWTAKLGTRGDVYEAYAIQELNLKPISSYLSKAFFKVGYQYYDFEFTGSNNWVGAPVRISEIKSTDLMLLTPMKNAQDIYFTFEVKF
jgi:hypothetical protein